MSDDVKDFLKLQKNAAKNYAQRDMDLWNNWVNNGKQPEDTEKLLNNFKGLIRAESNRWANQHNIPKSAIHSQFQTQAMRAFDTYDPNKGAKLSTHIRNQMNRGKRFVYSYQNIGRIPETRITKINDFNNSKFELEDKLGRPPTALEMADKMKWPIKQVVAMEHELRDEIPSSKFEGEMMTIKPSEDSEIFRLIQYELSPEEMSVFEHSVGLNGKPTLKPGQIASRLKMSPSKVSRIKNSIARKIEEFKS